jgi:hypothetical protein
MMNNPKPTERWQHYKGTVYEIIDIGKHTETLQEMVIYRKVDETGEVYGIYPIWIRPMDMFLEYVNDIPRFKKVET